MAASLVPTEGGSPIALDKPIMLIGRNQDCDISLQTSSKVSRRHCCIVQCGNRFLLRDLGSMNGVRVNTQRVIEAELNTGDEVAVADVFFTFRLDELVTKQIDRLQQNVPRIPAAPPSAAPNHLPQADSDAYPLAFPEQAEAHKPPDVNGDEPPDDEVQLKDDSQSEAGFVRV
ncbi:MAG TPA: FHA domain-containing protein [Planctomycetaceae bacterium]|nr:FHA domain-containing protein [Planctomycetaceae bacterium]